MSRFFGSIKTKVFQKTATANDSDTIPGYSPPTIMAYSATSPVIYKATADGNSSPAFRFRDSGITNDDDRYAFLSTFDTVFLIDDSGSMTGRSWREARRVLSQITSVCTAHDVDGVDMYFLNHRSATHRDGGYHNVTDPAAASRIFGSVSPRSVTMTGARLWHILRPYVDRVAAAHDVDDVRPVNVIVITDGAPTDDPESVIVQLARRLDALDAPLYQVGIQFFQVGSMPDARDALRHLDDSLTDMGIRDMVDTATWDGGDRSCGTGVLTADGILKVVLGAVVRRIDRQRASNDWPRW
ncbi:von Willebrand factor type A domain [Geosmithia morbida]|uniref:von Willebrand factor type A domain n=1 Tax=Geosmithia morbida TaxID=1094350 RepID=A0A9P5D4A4_9HYPO|nr:von Willebrand factor type A domain [Geosmithia morbida]KAF4125837.1 von Willebrand factor type A domain [Geosmithia morbida]